jgi:ABC-type amino acid transport substrate-binding protein
MLTLILTRLKKAISTPFIFASLFFLALPTCYAEQEVKIAFNNALTPYSIEKSENGIEVEIVRESLQNAGYKLVPVFSTPERKDALFDQKVVDGIATVNENSALHADYSNVYVTFQDVAITLKSRNLSINNLNDLKGKKISAYQGASSQLGNQFMQFAKNNPLYSEEEHQLNQNQLLFDGEVDVIIVDRTIFTYLNQMFGKSSAVVYQPIAFPKVPYRIAFHDATLRNKFNQGLKKLSKEDIATIYARYQEAIRFTP